MTLKSMKRRAVKKIYEPVKGTPNGVTVRVIITDNLSGDVISEVETILPDARIYGLDSN